MYIDIKLFAINEKELKTLLQPVRIRSQHIGMEFSIDKCTMLVMKSGKLHMTEVMELPNLEKIVLKKKKPTNTLKYWKLNSGNERKDLKSTTGESERYSRQNYIAGTLS